MTRALHSAAEVRDLIRGLTLLGTGGGGRPDLGLDYLLPHLAEGRMITWVSPEAIPDDAWTCTVFGMGSIAPTEVLSVAERVALGYPAEPPVPKPMIRAVQELEIYTGRPIEAIVPFELGAGNTAAPMDAALRLGLPVLDGDFAGRAIPELAQTTAALAGCSFTPGAVADPWGNVLIMKETGSDLLAERLGKMISLVTKLPDMKSPCAHAGFLLRGHELKEVIIPGGITRALTVGRAIRTAREAGRDPVKAAAEALKGWVLFSGTVVKKAWESREGYMFGTTTIEGEGEDRGHTFAVWFKNENHLAWRDGQSVAMSPDLIMVMDRESGEPYTNTVLPEGARVGVLGCPADEKLRSPKAVEWLGPRHYGFDLDYVPIEQMMGG